MTTPLPSPTRQQPFFQVSAIEAGIVNVPGPFFVDPSPPGSRWDLPALAFLLRHSATGQYFLFDLGIRTDYHNLTPATAKRISMFEPIRVSRDVADALAERDLKPSDIAHVCISHAHWDHIGDTARFPTSTFIMGAATRDLIQHGYPHDPNSSHAADLLPEGRTLYLDSKDGRWQPIGPFERALDFFADGSLYLVDAPGHCPGHLNALVRTSADGGWIFLAGDSAHDWRIVRGEARIAVTRDAKSGAERCIHHDRVVAQDHIERISKLLGVPRLRALLAHDAVWWEANKGGPNFWPNAIPSL
ncbi:Metallo-hydrolase/oxidoreductase [Amylostereum chailletii]|nr:Metallo-hydrolase/oxidoreductase [Amylostereum chailletii]